MSLRRRGEDDLLLGPKLGMNLRSFKKIQIPLLVVVAIVVFSLGLIASARRWEGLSAISYYLMGIIGLQAAIVAAFPDTKDHVNRIVRMTLLITAVVGLVFVSTFGWSFIHPPVYKVAVSLPFTNDWDIALPVYKAIREGFKDEGAKFLNNSPTRMTMYGKIFEIVPFDDSKIGDTNCTTQDACEIKIYRNNEKDRGELDKDRFLDEAHFSDITADPHVIAIIGPYNSGVALREMPAIHEANIPLISPANTADCLTDPTAANGDCDVKKLGKGSYFRTITSDSLRQKVLADYLWEHWRERPNGSCPDNPAPSGEAKVVIFRESGPRATTFSEGVANAFTAAWAEHASLKPATYPVASASRDEDLANTIRRLTFRPNIVIYSGTGDLGPRLYETLNREGYECMIFAGAGSLRGNYTLRQNTNILYAVDFATMADKASSNETDGIKYSSIYAASAYDATRMVIRSIFAAQCDDKNFFGYRLFSSIDSAKGPIEANLIDKFRRAVTQKLQWINTIGNVPYNGITGTYSFNSGDTDGAAGVTISRYVKDGGGTWGWEKIDNETNKDAPSSIEISPPATSCSRLLSATADVRLP